MLLHPLTVPQCLEMPHSFFFFEFSLQYEQHEKPERQINMYTEFLVQLLVWEKLHLWTMTQSSSLPAMHKMHDSHMHQKAYPVNSVGLRLKGRNPRRKGRDTYNMGFYIEMLGCFENKKLNKDIQNVKQKRLDSQQCSYLCKDFHSFLPPVEVENAP